MSLSYPLCVLLWVCLAICLVAIALLAFKLFVKFTTGKCRSNVRLVGKTAIVTGANAGIGFYTAEDFAKRGAKVILACRNPTRGQDAVERIIKATNNENVIFKKLDVSSIQSIKDFVEDINENEERLDILVNNAGIVGSGPAKAENGFLLTMQTNYFGPVLLTELLLDLLKKTPNSRIVNVSSKAAAYVKNFDVHQLNTYPENERLADIAVYSRSKLCNILYTIELAERLKGTSVTTYSIHPGVVSTESLRNMPLRVIFESFIKWFMKNGIEGAQTTIYCSVEEGIEKYSGEHFEDCHYVSKYKTARDPDLPKQLWIVTEDLIKKSK